MKRTYVELIDKLVTATKGSRELDLEIHKAAMLCDPSAIYSKDKDTLTYFKYYPDVPGCPSQPIEEPLPYYSSSLDAKLPWENIKAVACHESTSYAPIGKKLGVMWDATHVNPNTKNKTRGMGATEALARRVAALRTLIVNN